MSKEEYWFSAEECFSCQGKLKKENWKNQRVLVCETCGVVNASIPLDEGVNKDVEVEK